MTIPVQIKSWDFGEINCGRLADCLDALKMRDMRLVLVNKAPYTMLYNEKCIN